MTNDPTPLRRPGRGGSVTVDGLLEKVAHGDERAFEAFYDHVASQVYGVIRRILRDPAQSEEVTQEVFVELWRTAARFDPAHGTALTWTLTLAHRRAVDRVRSEQASTDRELKAAASDQRPAYDDVVEQTETRLEREQVRRCVGSLTELQRQAVELAYYAGYTYREVAEMLDASLGTIKTRMRDGLIRLRDCLGVTTGETGR